MGIVNNRCKNGDNYWVDAYVTPIHDGDRIVGYQSVRSLPERAHVRRAEAFYRNINRGTPAWRRILGRFIPGSFGKALISHTAGLGAGLLTVAVTGADAGGLI